MIIDLLSAKKISSHIKLLSVYSESSKTKWFTMRKFIFALAFLTSAHLLAAPSQTPPCTETNMQNSTEGGIVLFTPPTGWHQADMNALPPHIKIMVVGKGPSPFPPSMNLNVQKYSGTLKQYLKIVKDTNSSQGYEWKDLGTIRTEAGNASLSQFDHKGQWGEIRMMQVILIKNGMVYILSASALKDEFSIFYKDFFASMRSLRVAKNPIDMLPSAQQKTQLRNAIQNIHSQWETLVTQKRAEDPKSTPKDRKTALFNSQNFQTTLWIPFKEMLSQKYGMMGPDWQSIILKNTQDDLFDFQIN